MGGIQAREAAGECVVTVREYCPVGELAGNRHRYDVGTGVVIPWDVAGDPRSGVEACRSCVAVAEPCVSCGATNDGVAGGLCEPCFAAMPTGEWTTVRQIRENRHVADRSDEIDAYLRVRDYDSVEAWAADSDYVRHGDEWRDEHGNTVDIHECLIGVLDEQLRAHE